MRAKIFRFNVVVLAVFVSTNSFAETRDASSENTIPVAVYPQSVVTPMGFFYGNPKIQNPPEKKLAALINKIKTTICASDTSADVRVWVSADLQEDLWVVSAAQQSGIEVTLHCKEK